VVGRCLNIVRLEVFEIMVLMYKVWYVPNLGLYIALLLSLSMQAILTKDYLYFGTSIYLKLMLSEISKNGEVNYLLLRTIETSCKKVERIQYSRCRPDGSDYITAGVMNLPKAHSDTYGNGPRQQMTYSPTMRCC